LQRSAEILIKSRPAFNRKPKGASLFLGWTTEKNGPGQGVKNLRGAPTRPSYLIPDQAKRDAGKTKRKFEMDPGL
jgi:hypothetical protein